MTLGGLVGWIVGFGMGCLVMYVDKKAQIQRLNDIINLLQVPH